MNGSSLCSKLYLWKNASSPGLQDDEWWDPCSAVLRLVDCPIPSDTDVLRDEEGEFTPLPSSLRFLEVSLGSLWFFGWVAEVPLFRISLTTCSSSAIRSLKWSFSDCSGLFLKKEMHNRVQKGARGPC